MWGNVSEYYMWYVEEDGAELSFPVGNRALYKYYYILKII